MDQRVSAYDFGTLVHFRQRIEVALEGIRLRVEHNHNNEPKFLEDLSGWEKRAGERGAELERHLTLNGYDNEQKNDLEAALRKFEDGTYGFCEWPDCDVTIPFDRLEAIPQARYCLKHQVEVSKSKSVVTVLRGRKTRY